MKPHNIFIAQPKTLEQINALKAFMQALNIDFKMSKPVESPYNKEFTNKILQSREDFKNNKGIALSVDELDNLWK